MQKVLTPVGILVAGGLTWIVVLVMMTCLSTNQPWLSEMAWVGDALAPVGAVATVAALWHAFGQEAASAQQKHLDRLAEAYAGWVREAREILADMLAASQSFEQMMADKMAGSAFQPRQLNDVRSHLLQLRRRLWASRTAVMLFEDDEGLAARINTLTTTPMPVPYPSPTAERMAGCRRIVERLQRDRNELESIAETVIKRLRPGAPATAESPITDDEESAQ